MILENHQLHQKAVQFLYWFFVCHCSFSSQCTVLPPSKRVAASPHETITSAMILENKWEHESFFSASRRIKKKQFAELHYKLYVVLVFKCVLQCKPRSKRSWTDRFGGTILNCTRNLIPSAKQMPSIDINALLYTNYKSSHTHTFKYIHILGVSCNASQFLGNTKFLF